MTKPAGMFGVAPRQQPAMFGGEPIMYDAPQQERRMPFSPTGFLLDGGATMFGKPLMGAYNGWRQAMGYDQDPNAAPGYVTTDSIRKTGMDMAEGAVMGSVFAKAPAAALRSGVARPDADPLYHTGTTLAGQRFDPAKSKYDGTVFVSPDAAHSQSSVQGTRFNAPIETTKLYPSSDLNLFDHGNPKHVDRAMDWWRNNRGGEVDHSALLEGRKPNKTTYEYLKTDEGKQWQQEVRSKIERGEWPEFEPVRAGMVMKTSPKDNINEFLRENFDGYKMQEGGKPTVGIHRPNSLFREDGSTFYANNKNAAGAAAALDMSQDARLARAREQGFDTDTPVYHGTDKDFAAFDPDRSWGGQYWSTTDKASIEAGDVGAQGNGVIKKMFQRIKKPAGWKEYDQMGVDELIGRGYDGLALPDGKHMTYVAYEPNQYRDVNAAFDPAKINDPNLMSANPATGALVPFLDNREKKAAEDPAIANLREYLRKLYAAPAGVNANDPNLT